MLLLVRLCRPAVRKAYGFPAHAIFILREATPRVWQGVALLVKKGKLDGKAEPFRTAGRQSRKSENIRSF